MHKIDPWWHGIIIIIQHNVFLHSFIYFMHSSLVEEHACVFIKKYEYGPIFDYMYLIKYGHEFGWAII